MTPLNNASHALQRGQNLFLGGLENNHANSL